MRDADKSSSKTDETLDDAPATIRRPVLTFALKRRGTGHVVDAAWCGADEAHAEEVPQTLRCPSMAELPVEVAA